MQQVTLPGGETVLIPTTITDEWFRHRKTGYLDPSLLAPYAKQPRLYMDPAKLAELKASVASQGVRESLVLTPMCKAPWAVCHAGDENLPFLIVSGHRRRETAVDGSVPAVPVEVRIYQTEAEFNEDAETLNDHRQNLSEIEEGWRYRRKVEAGEKLTHLVERTGHPFQWIQGRIYLTHLCPTIQKMVGPNLKPRDRLAIGFASALGALALTSKFEFDQSFDIKAKLTEHGDKDPLLSDLSNDEKRFRLQRAYLKYCKNRGWKGVFSEKYVKTGQVPDMTKSGRAGRHHNGKATGERHKPSGLRMQLVEWIRYLNETNLLDMSEADISKALSNTVAQDLEAMADRIEMVSEVLRSIAEKKTRYSDVALGTQKRPEQQVLSDC